MTGEACFYRNTIAIGPVCSEAPECLRLVLAVPNSILSRNTRYQRISKTFYDRPRVGNMPQRTQTSSPRVHCCCYKWLLPYMDALPMVLSCRYPGGAVPRSVIDKRRTKGVTISLRNKPSPLLRLPYAVIIKCMTSAHLHASGQDRSVKMTAPPKRIHRGNWLRLPARITGRGGAATGGAFSRCRGLSVNRLRRQSLFELALALLSGQALDADGFPGGQCRMLSLRLFVPNHGTHKTVRVAKGRQDGTIRGNILDGVAVRAPCHRSPRTLSSGLNDRSL